MDKPSKNKKKPYTKPAVIFSKKIEAVTAVCASSKIGPGSGTCKTQVPTCQKLYSEA